LAGLPRSRGPTACENMSLDRFAQVTIRLYVIRAQFSRIQDRSGRCARQRYYAVRLLRWRGSWTADDSLIAGNAQREFVLYPLEGGAPQPVNGLEAGEAPVQFGAGDELYVWNGAFPARIMAVDLKSGQRQPAATLAPADPAGVLYGEVVATPDGKMFAYRYRRAVTNLFLAEGLK
jgi:hypothetical protein